MNVYFQELPAAPKNLSEDAAAKFIDLCQQMMAGPGLRSQDIQIIEIAAVAYENTFNALKRVAELGVAIAKDGNTKTNAFSSEARYWQDIFVKRLIDLGLARDRNNATGALTGSSHDKGQNIGVLKGLRVVS